VTVDEIEGCDSFENPCEMMASVKDTGDSSNKAVLDAFGLASDDEPLGRGGEAAIYALDSDRILRVLHQGGDTDQIRRNKALLRDLRRSAVPFQIPEILEFGEIAGRTYAVERLLPGRSLMELLKTVEGPKRDHLIESYLEAAQGLGDLRPDGWKFYGELATAQPLQTETWGEFLITRAAKSLAKAGYPLDQVRAEGLALDLPETARPEFVHLDAFAGNMLSDGERITAVVDFGSTCVAGDRRFDPLAAVAYLEPQHLNLPISRPRDGEVARAWLRSAGLLDMLEPARRWVAAYWAFAVNDAPLHAWCRSVLLQSG
jgi:putative membrane protein